MTASFAYQTETMLTAEEWAKGSIPRAKAQAVRGRLMTQAAASKASTQRLKGKFAQVTRGARVANDVRLTPRKKGSAMDGMLGGMILEGIFFSVFPGLSLAFNGLTALDTVDLYDTAREAFADTRKNRFAAAPRRATSILPQPRVLGLF